MELNYRKAVQDDAELLIEMYNAAFHADYIRYGECPAYGKTKEAMELSIAGFPKYIILSKEVPAGVISLVNRGDGQYHLGCLCIIPKYQGKGIGSRAFRHMLSVFPDWKRITLETPADKEENIVFYTKKCGFHTGNKEMDGNVEVITFYMER